MRKNLMPSISVVIATFNSQRTISKCLNSVVEQDYPMNKVEIIIADGGSKDNTLFVAKKFGAKIVKVDPLQQNAEYNKGVGLSKAKNEIIFFLDHDNILPHKNWLAKLALPFIENKNVIGVEPLRFKYSKQMTLLDRYCALLGGSDPIVFYLGKDSHLSWAYNEYNLFGSAVDCGKYYLVKYAPDKIPALGGNGAGIRRNLLIKYAKADPENFIHIDVIADLIKKGFNNYALIKDSIIHLTNNKLFPFLIRRKYFIETYYLNNSSKRRLLMYDPKRDKIKLGLYIIYSLTLIVPFYYSIRGFLKIKDMAWFLHPFMCLAFLFIYGFAVINKKYYEILGK